MEESDFQFQEERLRLESLRANAWFIDIHSFGDWRIFLDGKPDEKTDLSYDPKTTLPWIIHREDLLAINDLHQRLAKNIDATAFQRVVLTLHMCDMIEEEMLSRRKTVYTLKPAA